MRATVDGNEAAASVAYRLNEVCCIYPITPSSPMAELADEWASQGRPNVWGTVPAVVEMQSEGGAAGALHGALQSGALATTFTASQGLLLMIPNMYKIAGELTPAVLHVAARSLAAQGLSIFGDHSDVMAVRQTGFALLASASVQEAHDLALVAQAATLRTRVPFVHFFDGFRTSHELNTIDVLSDDDLRAFVPEEFVQAHRGRALSPERPFIRGTAQNPDVYFQARETVNPFYARVPDVVEDVMADLDERTGRRYHIVDYSGDPEAERVLVMMGSGGETIRETVASLNAHGERVGVAQVRLYRPFPAQALADALPDDCASHRRPRSDEGARFGRRAALPRHGRGTHRVVCRWRAEGDAEGRRRPLRAVLEGVHAGDGRGRVRRVGGGAPAAPVHDRDHGRRLRDEPRLRRVARHRAARDGARDLLRPGLGRDGRREQEHDQDPRRRGPARAGLLRLRLEEVRLADGLAPPLRAGADPGALPRAAGGLRRMPPVRAARPSRRARPRGGRRDAAAQLPAPAGRGVGDAVAPGAGADPRQACRRVHDRRRPDRARGRPRRTDKHRPADLLLRPLRSLAARAGNRADQGSGREDLRSPWRRGGRAQPGRGRPRAGRSAPGRGARAGDGEPRAAAGRARARAGVRSHRHSGDAGRPGRRAAGQRAAGGRHISERHGGLREAQHLGAGRGLGRRPLHPVRQLQLRLPAQRDPLEVLRPAPTGGRPGRVPVGAAGGASACRTPGTRCRSTSRTAPAAGCASRRARLSRRATLSSRRSTLQRASRSSPPSETTSRSSRRCPRTTGRGWTSARCAAPSSWSRCSSSPAPARAAARPRT